MEGKLLTSCLKKWKKMERRVKPSTTSCECCQKWPLWPSSSSSNTQEEKFIPRDVPKGHLVVYVGEDMKRYIIKVNLLNHALFKPLLDQAKEEYDFDVTSKLCLPCDEKTFLSIVRHCARNYQM